LKGSGHLRSCISALNPLKPFQGPSSSFKLAAKGVLLSMYPESSKFLVGRASHARIPSQSCPNPLLGAHPLRPARLALLLINHSCSLAPSEHSLQFQYILRHFKYLLSYWLSLPATAFLDCIHSILIFLRKPCLSGLGGPLWCYSPRQAYYEYGVHIFITIFITL